MAQGMGAEQATRWRPGRVGVQAGILPKAVRAPYACHPGACAASQHVVSLTHTTNSPDKHRALGQTTTPSRPYKHQRTSTHLTLSPLPGHSRPSGSRAAWLPHPRHQAGPQLPPPAPPPCRLLPPPQPRRPRPPPQRRRPGRQEPHRRGCCAWASAQNQTRLRAGRWAGQSGRWPCQTESSGRRSCQMAGRHWPPPARCERWCQWHRWQAPLRCPVLLLPSGPPC